MKVLSLFLILACKVYADEAPYWLKKFETEDKFTKISMKFNEELPQYKDIQKSTLCAALYTGKVRTAKLNCIGNVTTNGIDYYCHSYEVNLGTGKTSVRRTPFGYTECTKDDAFRFWQIIKAPISAWASYENFASYIYKDKFKVTKGYKQVLKNIIKESKRREADRVKNEEENKKKMIREQAERERKMKEISAKKKKEKKKHEALYE